MNEVQEQGDLFAWRDALIAELTEESIRRKALVEMRAFRSSWRELGRLLIDIASGGDYKEWGYEDFEIYCARELGLKKQTVKKLVVSYNYLKSYHPELLESGCDSDLPSAEAVAALSAATTEGSTADQDKLRDVEAKIFSGKIDGKEAVREVKATYEDAAEKRFASQKRKIAGMARKMREEAARCDDIPDDLKDETERVLREIEAVLH